MPVQMDRGRPAGCLQSRARPLDCPAVRAASAARTSKPLTLWGRRAWHRLAGLLTGRRRALVLTHDYPDPDALASGWAMVEIVRTRLALPAALAYGGRIDRPENRAMVELLGVPARELSSLDFAGRPAVILVDASPGAGNCPLEHPSEATAVLDTHSGASAAGLGSRLRRACSATSTLAAELCLAAGLVPGARLATALLYGIKTDTQALGREAWPADEAAYRWLLPLADHRLLARVESPPLPARTLRTLWRALSDARLYGRAAVADLGRLNGREGPAETADLLSRLAGISCVLAHGWWDGRQVFSVRAVRGGRSAWSLARAAAGGEGPAGGHSTFAGGSLPADGPAAGARAGRRMERRFLRAARAGKKRGVRLVAERGRSQRGKNG